VIEMAVQKAADRLRPSIAEFGAERAHLLRQLAAIGLELERLTAAIVAGGELATLMDAIKTREAAKAALERRTAALAAQEALGTINPATLANDMRAKLDDWRGLLRRHVPQARQILKKLFPQPLRLGPDDDGGFALRGQASVEKLVQGIPCANTVASPAGPAKVAACPS
jgi:hypothetical protein